MANLYISSVAALLAGEYIMNRFSGLLFLRFSNYTWNACPADVQVYNHEKNKITIIKS